MMTEGRSSEAFREVFLDLWYEREPGSFMNFYEIYDAEGMSMMSALEDENYKLYKSLYSLTKMITEL